MIEHDSGALEPGRDLREQFKPLASHRGFVGGEAGDGRSKVHPHVAAIAPTQARKRLRERRELRLHPRIVFVVRVEDADAPHAVALLRVHRERPCRRAAEERDEVAPSKSR